MVKYHSIIKSVATPKRQIEKCGLKDEIRNTNRNLLDGPGYKVLVFIVQKTGARKRWVADFIR